MAKLGEYGERLETMTTQEVFDVSCDHLLMQGKPSYSASDKVCVYKGEGVCCAAAPFIKDYADWMETNSWHDVRHTDNHESLISNLQEIHDEADPDFSGSVVGWPKMLKDLADEFNLKPTELLIKHLGEKQ